MNMICDAAVPFRPGPVMMALVKTLRLANNQRHASTLFNVAIQTLVD
jgi:hypothetical protein